MRKWKSTTRSRWGSWCISWRICASCSSITTAWPSTRTDETLSWSRWTWTVCTWGRRATFLKRRWSPSWQKSSKTLKMNGFLGTSIVGPRQGWLRKSSRACGGWRHAKSQNVLQGCVQVPKPAHMGSQRSGTEWGGRQSHQPQVPDGERKDADLFVEEAGDDWVLRQVVGAAGRHLGSHPTSANRGHWDGFLFFHKILSADRIDCNISVPVVHFIPLGCLSSNGGRKVLGEMASSSSRKHYSFMPI